MEYGKEQKTTGSEFSNAITSRLGGETLTRCYQCGTCVSSCPVARLTDEFNPREIIKLSLLEESARVLSSDSIWLCCSCYSCQERCPQKVEIADVIYAIRNIAFEKGYIPNIYSEFASAILDDGRIVNISKFMEQKRSTIGLPPLTPTGVDALRKILSATGFDKLQKEVEEA